MGKRKKVTFADLSGKSLETVLEITPRNSCEDLSAWPFSLELSDKSRPSHCQLKCCFEQPGSRDDFFERVKEQHLSLESAVCDRLAIRGFVRVFNEAFEKEVSVRYTTDGWKTCRDIKADYVPISTNRNMDRFFFRIPLPDVLQNGTTIQFAVRYTVNGCDFWDNNFQKDYCILYCNGAV